MYKCVLYYKYQLKNYSDLPEYMKIETESIIDSEWKLFN